MRTTFRANETQVLDFLMFNINVKYAHHLYDASGLHKGHTNMC